MTDRADTDPLTGLVSRRGFFDDLHAMIPFDAVPIAVDLVDDAISLPAFQHR